MEVEKVHAWFAAFNDAVQENKDYLTDLDRAIGDSDHGTNMARGMAAVAALDPGDFETAADYVKKAGMTLVSTVGGASGPLYGTFFLRFSVALADDDLAKAFRAGYEGIVQRGKAKRGDKTMLDALGPAVEALEASGELEAAAKAAAEGRDEAKAFVAKKGRASYLGERSAGHIDPGTASMTYLVETARELS